MPHAVDRLVLTLALVFGLTVSQAWHAQDSKAAPPPRSGPYEFIDSHALSAPEAVERSIQSLAEYLTIVVRADREKARAVFRWMTDRIAYNAEDFLAGRPAGDCSAKAVLESRKSVCAGYANLFEQLAREAGLEVLKISGVCKGYGYVHGESKPAHHAWNAVRIDGEWYMIDCTWGAGSVDKKKGFVKELNEHWFLTPPERFIFSHFPNNPAEQFLTQPIEANTYHGWPEVPTSLFTLGVQATDVRDTLNEKDFRGLVRTYETKGHIVRVLKAPLRNHLSAGASYKLELEAKSCLGLAVINDDKWQYVSSIDGLYRVTITPHEGKLKVSGRFPGRGTTYWTILEYVVE